MNDARRGFVTGLKIVLAPGLGLSYIQGVSRRNPFPGPMPSSVKHIRAFEDASGVDCIIVVDGHTYSANVLGDERLTLIRPSSGSRCASKRAASIAAHDFSEALALTVDDEWRTRNAEMYDEES